MFKMSVDEFKEEKQKQNIQNAFDYLVSKKGKSKINEKALDRFMSQMESVLGMSQEQVYDKIENDIEYAFAVASIVAVLASRQGISLETEILMGLEKELLENGTVQTFEDLPAQGPNAWFPERDTGELLCEVKGKQVNADKYLKSIDGTFTTFDGTTGLISAKVLSGQGGHQDNVEAELIEFAKWTKKHQELYPNECIYVCLVDGRKMNNKIEETDRLWVCDHIEFQERLLAFTKKTQVAA